MSRTRTFRRRSTIGAIWKHRERWAAKYKRHGVWHTPGHTFTTAKLADDWLCDEQRLIDRDEWTPPADRRRTTRIDSTTFRDYASRWIDTRLKKGQSLAESTRHEYRRYLGYLGDIGDEPLAATSRDDWREWYSKLCPDKPVQRARVYAFVCSVLASAVDDELIPASPLKIRGASRAVSDKTNLRLPTAAEIDTIADHMPPDTRLAVLLAAWCGLRAGEIIALQRRDIDLEAPSVTVARAASRAGAQWIVKAPKSEAGRRIVPMPSFLVAEVRKHLDTYAGPRRDDWVFPADDGGMRTHAGLIGTRGGRYKNGQPKYPTRYCKAIDETGLGWVTFHMLRHFFGTQVTWQGAGPKDAMTLMGQSTMSAWQRYQHTDPQRQRELAAALDQLHTGDTTTAAPGFSGDLLGRLTPGQIAAMIDTLNDTEAAELLSGLPPERLADIWRARRS
ncbi:site-specific integrase [Cutibacterium granulosum]|uniref:tyrosine-type recombinase/integrase n=1 Tax=Cutibacterium granulosum TaxID=33011 RepID=UPI002B229BD6|nr:site-specific integrase [Cutibacterium granulosum]MEA5638390.1 site-specific integrase [Cutibacterium granulosum]